MSISYYVTKWAELQAPNPAMLRHILVSEGYSVQQWGDSPDSVIPMCKNEKEQSHWIISGSIEMRVERFGTFVLEPGDRGHMPAGTYYSARVLGDEHVIYLVGEK